MFTAILPETTLRVNPSQFPGSTHTGTISATNYLAGLAAIDDAFRTDCATIKTRFGRRNHWPREAYDLEQAAQDRYDVAFDALDSAYNWRSEGAGEEAAS